LCNDRLQTYKHILLSQDCKTLVLHAEEIRGIVPRSLVKEDNKHEVS